MREYTSHASSMKNPAHLICSNLFAFENRLTKTQPDSVVRPAMAYQYEKRRDANVSCHRDGSRSCPLGKVCVNCASMC